MTVHTIPIRNDVEHHEFQVELDGVLFTLEFRWNARAEGWFASLFDGEGEELARGMRVVVDLPLFARMKDERWPAGFLFVQDTTGRHRDPGRYELGSSAVLLYADAAEVAA
jgi:hypothetical protein